MWPGPDVKLPVVWKNKLSSGISVLGIDNREVPLVQFQVQIKGAMLLENAIKLAFRIC
jgi:zinc protease